MCAWTQQQRDGEGELMKVVIGAAKHQSQLLLLVCWSECVEG